MKTEYSDWFKIDLHIHTDKSKETKEKDYSGNFDINTLKEKLKENNVEIFALTDHNIINVDAYKNYYNSYNEKTDPLLLLGIELDIQGSSKSYHSLLVFNHCEINAVEKISKALEEKFTNKGITDKKQRSLSFDDIVDIYKTEDFFFIPHAGSSHKNIVQGNIDSITATQRMLILMQSALEKVTKEETIQHYEVGFNKILDTPFQNQKDIAYINFSDNHNCEEYPNGNGRKHSYYYIKGKKTFESIRLAFIDPDSRIKSTDQFNQINISNNAIEKIDIEPSNVIQKTELFFSPHLNAIIGGRSSGKSMLMWILGTKIDGIKVDDNKYKINTSNIKLKTKNDAELKEKVSLGQSFIYLEQGDIIRYFEEKKLDELAKKSGKGEEYNIIMQEIKYRKNELTRLQQDLLEEYELAYKNCSSKQFTLHNKTIQDCLSANYIIKVDSEKIISKYSIQEYTQNIDLLNNTQNSLNRIKAIEILNFTKGEQDIIDQVIQVLKDKSELLKKSKTKNEWRIHFIDKVDNIIKEKNETLDEGSKRKTMAISTIKELRDNIKSRFQRMKALRNSSNALEEFDYSNKKSIKLDESTTLSMEIKKDKKIKEIILDGFNEADNTKTLYISLCDLIDNKITIKNYRTNNPVDLKKKIDTQLNVIFNIMDTPFDYLEYIDGTTSLGNSPGYNSEQYLKIVLANSNIKTIFIDQPEDNLGNQFISKDLVKQIRDIKFQKQIFLVTHNPSIVIYGDAESVILAENKDNKITYKQLVIEDKESQKLICDTLDGGRYIFNNRARKYNIHRLNMEEQTNE